MDEKIEEMAKLIKPIVASSYLVDRGNDEVKQNAINEVKKQQTRNATALYNAGYRKESDTARELAKTIKSVVWEEFENETIRIKDLHGVIDDILRSKYGVDLGE